MLRFSFGNINGKAFGLNANEMSVYEAIAKCSRKDDARGWYASMQALSDALPFVVGRSTVARSVDKLIYLGLVEKRGNSLYAIAQNEQCIAQNEQPITQIEQPIAQNDQNPTPPNNPLFIIKEKMKENKHTHVPAHDAELPTPSFEEFLDAFGKAYTPLTRHGAEIKWDLCSKAKKLALMAALKDGTWDKPRPDWCIGDFSEPEPEFLRGDEPGDLVQVKYNGRYRICRRSTMKLFNLEFYSDWKQ